VKCKTSCFKKKCKIRLGNKICYYKKDFVEQKEEFLMPKKLTVLKKNWEQKCKIPKQVSRQKAKFTVSQKALGSKMQNSQFQKSLGRKMYNSQIQNKSAKCQKSFGEQNAKLTVSTFGKKNVKFQEKFGK
jgi:flagellar biosynthesis GTPase FlhF